MVRFLSSCRPNASERTLVNIPSVPPGACTRGSGAIFHDEPFMADAVQEHHHSAKRRRCRGKQEAGRLPHCSSRLFLIIHTCMYILYRQTCLSLSDRGQLCLPQDNQERVLLPGHFAVVVAALDSRLSRELEVTLYTVDWGMRGPTS